MTLTASAQKGRALNGYVADKNTQEKLYAATVVLTGEKDSKKKYHAVTGSNGEFSFPSVVVGVYTMQVSYLGYKTKMLKIDLVANKIPKLSPVELVEDAILLNSVEVAGRATRAEQKGDSLIYNASAFKVLDGSTAEDLLAKMPGIVVEGGTVQAQGEAVKKIYVDGKEFFDGDINLAIKNLPSDIIASIEVFDKMSEQSEFTGFDDGESVKTINIVTKGGFSEGNFGKLYGGYGTEERYNAGGNLNFFNGDRRISLLGLANNVNNQNFSQEDISGVMSASSGGGRGRRGHKGGGGGKGGGGKGGGGGSRGGARGGSGSASDFMIGEMGGVTTSNAFGLNYVDKWGEKLKMTGSFFYNQSSNDNETDSRLEYFEASLKGKTYEELSRSQMDNHNYRINMKIDYDIDNRNKLQIKPKASFQNNDRKSFLSGTNLFELQPENAVETNSITKTDAYTMGADINYKHAFRKMGRSLSLSLSGNVSNTESDSYYDYLNTVYAEGNEETADEHQKKVSDSKKVSYRGSLAYTDRLWEGVMLQVNYRFSYSDDDSDKKTYTKSAVSDLYDQLDESLSNVFSSSYFTHSGGLALRYRTGKFSLMGGVNLQQAILKNDQEFPAVLDMKRDFVSVLPSALMNYTINGGNALRLQYRASSSAPSVSALQDVIDNTNPLMVTAGNPNLKEQIGHAATLRYTRTLKTGQTFIAMLGATFRANYVSDSSYVAKKAEEIVPGVTLDKGSQYTRPVNMSGYYSMQGMLTYGFPVDFLKSNINLSLSANYANVPNIFEGVKNMTRELNLIPKIIVGSNISERLDFTLSYSAAVNCAKSDLEGSETDKYINHSAQAKFGWTVWKGITLASTFRYVRYSGLGEGIDYYLWNASIGKKFLKNNAAEIKLEAFDLLRENRSFNRTVGSNYYEYTSGNVLKPYAMLSFVYTLRPKMQK